MSRLAPSPVRRLLCPDSVAVFGASEDKAKFGGRIVHNLLRHGFAGRLVPVNPRHDRILGRPCYPTIAAAPGPVDVAILAVPRDALLAMVEECGRAGVGCCVILTIGFAESGSADGATAQVRLAELGRRYGMRLLGPNCLGLVNAHHRLALTSSITMEVPRLIGGEVGFVSQSGALMASVHDRAHACGIGFSACVSLGNQVDLEVSDFLEYMVEDPTTRVVCLYVEGFKDPQRFLRAASAARRAGKPVILLKVGRTAAGERAARSHTASLAGSYAVMAAACREHGVVLADDPDAMVRAASLIARWGAPRGDGIGILSPSGGWVSIVSDRAVEMGLRLSVLGEPTRARLREVLFAPQTENPVDIGGRLSSDIIETAGDIMRTLAADPDVSASLIVLGTMPFFTETTAALARAGLASGKPTVVAVTPGTAADAAREALRELECPFTDWLDDVLRTLRIWTDCRRVLEAPRVHEPARPSVPASAAEAVRRAPAGPLTEPEAKALLAAYEIPVNPGRLAQTPDEAAAAACEIGFPVAVKAVSRRIVHKTDAGAVRLGLADEASVRLAFEEAIAAARRHDRSAPIEGCLVQAMVSGEAELLAGVRRDPQFGPIVLVGSGGILAEVLRDVRMALAPVSADRAGEMLRGLRVWPVLDGVRGRPALDVDAVSGIVSRLSWLAVDLDERLIDLEANPIVVRPAGRGAVVVDARGTLEEGQCNA